MDTNKLELLLTKGNYVFVIGNGINQYAELGSWADLLKNLTNEDDSLRQMISEDSKSEISFFEIYDLLKLQKKSTEIRNSLLDKIEQSYTKKDDRILKIRNALKDLKFPILTTNYDRNLDFDLNKHYLDTSSNFTRIYPWNVCYSDIEKGKFDTLNDFAVWHINGVVDYKESIRLGLKDYAGLFAREKKFYVGNSNEKSVQPNFSTRNTWLDIFFKKPLCIIGLGLEKDEIFLRHLLLKRYQYRKNGCLTKIAKDSPADIFICANKDEKAIPFLELLGFEIVRTKEEKDYSGMYENTVEVLKNLKTKRK